MKKFKAILALVLVACLFVTLFAACANTEEKPNTDNTNTNTNTNTPGSDDKAPGTDKEVEIDTSEGEVLVPFEDEREIIVVLYDMRSTGGDYGDAVEEYANTITKETLNVVADYRWINSGDWQSKATVALTGGERFDVMNLNPMARVTNLYPQGLLMDISEYVADYGAEVYELTKDYVGTYMFQGGLYGFPTVRNYCKNGYILMRQDVLEELGMVEFAENMKSWSDYEQVLAAVKANYDGVYFGTGLSSPNAADNLIAGDNFSDAFPYDGMGDGTVTVYVNQDTAKVEVIQASDYYKKTLEINQGWFDKGYIWPDSAITTEFVDDVQKQGVIFSNICGSEHGVKVTKSAAYGFDIVVCQYVTGMVKTTQPIFTGITVPVTCEEPEAAVAWINELYTNPDLQMALVYGVPEDDYVIEAGEVVRLKEQGYLNVDFVLGNSLLLKPLKGNGADFYDVVGQINASAAKSKFLGFSIDTTGMDMWISQITAVTDQYASEILYGGYTPETLEEYIGKLTTAGVYDYAAAIQEQLDAWIAANK